MGTSFSRDFQQDQEDVKDDHAEHLEMLSSAGQLMKDCDRILQKPVCEMVESSYSRLLEEFKTKLATFLAGAQLVEDTVEGFTEMFLSIVREVFHGEMREFPSDGKGRRTCCQCKKSGQFRYHVILTARYQYANIYTEYETVEEQKVMKYDRSRCRLYVCCIVDIRRRLLEDNNA